MVDLEEAKSSASSLVMRAVQVFVVAFGVSMVLLLPLVIGQDFVSSDASLLMTYLHGSVVVLLMGGGAGLVVWLLTRKLDLSVEEE